MIKQFFFYFSLSFLIFSILQAGMTAPTPQLPVQRNQDNLTSKNSRKIDQNINYKSSNINSEATRKLNYNSAKRNRDIGRNVEDRNNNVNREAASKVSQSLREKSGAVDRHIQEKEFSRSDRSAK